MKHLDLSPANHFLIPLPDKNKYIEVQKKLLRQHAKVIFLKVRNPLLQRGVGCRCLSHPSLPPPPCMTLILALQGSATL